MDAKDQLIAEHEATIQRLQDENAELKRELELHATTEDAYAGGAFETINRLKEALRVTMRERDYYRSSIEKWARKLSNSSKSVESQVEESLQRLRAEATEFSSPFALQLVDKVYSVLQHEQIKHYPKNPIMTMQNVPDGLETAQKAIEITGARLLMMALIERLRRIEQPTYICAQIMHEITTQRSVHESTVQHLDLKWVRNHIGRRIGSLGKLHEALNIVAAQPPGQGNVSYANKLGIAIDTLNDYRGWYNKIEKYGKQMPADIEKIRSEEA